MSNYKEFLQNKTKSKISSGFDINESLLNNNLFKFHCNTKYFLKFFSKAAIIKL